MASTKKSVTPKPEALTADEQKLVARVLQATWTEIAYEVCSEGDVTRAEAIELTLDADRPMDHAKTPDEKAALKKFNAMLVEAQDAFAKTVFKHSRYGL